MTAAAHPTPDLTWIASKSQFFAHAPHSMHLAEFTGTAFRFSMMKTSWGQTSMHLPQPVHFSALKVNVSESLKYFTGIPTLKLLIILKV